MRAFVVAAPGLEPFVEAELRELGIRKRVRAVHGGVEAELTTRQLYLVHRWSRCATRVLVRVADGIVHRFDELEALIASVDWAAYVEARTSVDVRAASSASTLYHEGAIVERVVRAMGRTPVSGAASGAAPVATSGAQRIQVRIERNRATVSVDATGDGLHRRGWRSIAHAAPLRPTLAAAMLRAAGYDGSAPVVDPMTGSGTIAVEAAAVALGRPNDRPFACTTWPSFEPGTWASASVPRPGPNDPATIVAADRDAGAVEAARAHAAAAGVDTLVTVEHGALFAQRWPTSPSLVVCNPPYGRRVGGRDLRDLYAALGARVSDGGHRLCLLAADDRLARATGIDLAVAFSTTNGGIPVRCWLG